ncbi:MAG: hypothetical protein JEZ11_19005 [Desulfobacterales bacterium]|nr:hypothetical protein [Desulfobacterales bacterium]
MDTPRSAVSKSFSEIRRDLDPCCSYIILESGAANVTEQEMQQAFDALPWRPGDILEKRLCREKQTRRWLVVAKLAPDCGDSIKDRVLQQSRVLPMTLYHYGRGVDGFRHVIQRLCDGPALDENKTVMIEEAFTENKRERKGGTNEDR